MENFSAYVTSLCSRYLNREEQEMMHSPPSKFIPKLKHILLPLRKRKTAQEEVMKDLKAFLGKELLRKQTEKERLRKVGELRKQKFRRVEVSLPYDCFSFWLDHSRMLGFRSVNAFIIHILKQNKELEQGITVVRNGFNSYEKRALTALSKIGNNINQVTKKFHSEYISKGKPTHTVKEMHERLQRELETLRDLITNTNGDNKKHGAENSVI